MSYAWWHFHILLLKHNYKWLPSYTVKKNPDEKLAQAGLHRTTRIEPDFYPVDSHPVLTRKLSEIWKSIQLVPDDYPLDCG